MAPAFDRLPRVRQGFTTLELGDASGLPAGGDAVTRALGGDEGSWSRHGLRQVHGAAAIEAGDAEPGAEPPEGDALWTAQPGRLLVIRTADCVPILLAALGAGGVRGVAAVHAGWRGLAGGVVAAAVAALRRGADASRVVAVLGPSIGPCCYEVGPDVAAPLLALGDPGALRAGPGDRAHADLPRLARFLLAASGSALAQPGEPPCTRCHPELFPSYRRDGSASLRMASFIGLGA